MHVSVRRGAALKWKEQRNLPLHSTFPRSTSPSGWQLVRVAMIHSDSMPLPYSVVKKTSVQGHRTDLISMYADEGVWGLKNMSSGRHSFA